MPSVSFRGQSGRARTFTETSLDSDWARQPGIALFAARHTYGWRIVRMIEMTGRMHDVQPVWAQLDAARYGATAIFIHNEPDFETRRAALADLEAGLSPVLPAFAGTQPAPMQMAA